MDHPGISLFNPQHLEVLHEADVEDEEDEDAEEAKRIEEEVAKGLQGAFDDLDLDLDEEDEEEEDEQQNDNYKFATSTPYVAAASHDLMQTQDDALKFHALNPEETELGDPSTPVRNPEYRYLHSENRQGELEILYQARGREINRLNAELQQIKDANDTDLRLCKHNLAIVKGEKENLTVNVEQLQDLLHGANEENRNLRAEIEALKASVAHVDKSKEELMAQIESSEYMISGLQSQLIDLQRSDAALKARQQHDSIVRSLKDRHENEIYLLQQEVDRLNTKNRRCETNLDDWKTKMVDQQRKYEEALIEKTDRIQELNDKIESVQRFRHNNDESAAEFNETKKLVHGFKNENEDLKRKLVHANEIIQSLKTELNGANDSLVALGMADGDDTGNGTQVKEALHRSIISNKSKMSELEKVKKEIHVKDCKISELNKAIQQLQNDLLSLQNQRNNSALLMEKDRKIEGLKSKLDSNQKVYEENYNEKSKIISTLNQRLEENQKKVTDLLSDKITSKSSEHELSSIKITLKEKESERDDFIRTIQSLQSDLRGYETLVRRLSSGDAILNSADQSNIHEKIRVQLQKSLQGNNDKRNEIIKLQTTISELKSLIRQLEDKSQKSENTSSYEEIKSKYANLKKKVRIYQKHCQNKENFYIQERKAMEEEYKSILLALKSKMENAYITKEQQVELELLEMKDHFNSELQKITKIRSTQDTLSRIRDDVVSSINRRISSESPRRDNDQDYFDDDDTSCGISEISKRTLKENHRPSSAKSEQLNQLFEKAQEDIRNRLQKPLTNLNI